MSDSISVADRSSQGSPPPRDTGATGKPVKKRKRVSYSCIACTARKGKCDRGRPCQPCASRGADCRYLIDGYEDPVDFLGEVRDRLDRMEALLLAGAASRPVTATTSPPGALPPPATAAKAAPPAPAVDAPPAGFVSTEGHYFGPSASASVDDRGKLAHLFQTYSAPHDKDSEASWGGQRRLPLDLFHDLPTRQVCDNLIDYYFTHINFSRYPFNEAEFRTMYLDVWSTMLSGNLPARVTHLLSLFFIVLAIATLTAPAQDVLLLDPNSTQSLKTADDYRRHLAHGLYASSCRARALSAAILVERGDHRTVLADLLTVRYLILVRRASDGYEVLGSAIHRAYSLGLHRRREGLAAADEENRRRIWSYLLHLDRYLALLLGLPLCISKASCDVEPPSNVNVDGRIVPLDQLTKTSFLVLRNSLFEVAARVASEAFAIGGVAYSTIVSLEEELQRWEDSLPPFFRLVPHGQAYEPPPPGDASLVSLFEIQRYLLSTEVRFIRMTLHRPYLASPGNAASLSREVCISSAMADLWARLTAYPLSGLQNLSSGSYRVSISIVVLGVALLLSPSPERAQEIRDCLVDFVVTRRGQSARSSLDEGALRDIATRELTQLRAVTQAAAVAAAGIAPKVGDGDSGASPSLLASGSTNAAPTNVAPPSVTLTLPQNAWSDTTGLELPDQHSYDVHASAQHLLNTLSFPSATTNSTFNFLPPSSSHQSPAFTTDSALFSSGSVEQDLVGLSSMEDINWDIFNNVLDDMGVAGSTL